MATTPDKLFKYCSTDAALQILESRTLRWSSPIIFGDPLELDSNAQVNFDRDALLQSTIKLASAMIFAADKPRGDTPLINAIRRWREEERFTNPEEAEIVLQELLSKMVDQSMLNVAKLQQTWQDYNRKLRVCCFCARPDNIVAWDRFGDNHRGVCFRFDTSNDAMAKNPRPIFYKNERPELAKLREQIDAILFNVPLNVIPDFENLLSVKPLTRKPEQEWRCFRHSDTLGGNDPRSWVDAIAFNNTELSAACFGISTPLNEKKAILKILQSNYPSARSYQANLASGRYELEIQKA